MPDAPFMPSEAGKLFREAFAYYRSQSWVPQSEPYDHFVAGIAWFLWALERTTGDGEAFDGLINGAHRELQSWLLERGDPESLFRIFEEMSRQAGHKPTEH